MPTYCYRCPLCNRKMETFSHVAPACDALDHAQVMVRDWKRENVGVAVVNLKAERERGDIARTLLPTKQDFAGPGDPDGEKGLRAWRDEHAPSRGNKTDIIGNELAKKVY